MVTANRFWSQIFGIAFSNKRWLHFFLLFVPVTGMWTSAVGIIGLAFNLRAYDFISQELKAAEGIRIWSAILFNLSFEPFLLFTWLVQRLLMGNAIWSWVFLLGHLCWAVAD